MPLLLAVLLHASLARAEFKCEALVDPEIQAFDHARCESPRDFRNRERIKERLSAHAIAANEVGSPHRQWQKTCYLYNGVANVNAALISRRQIERGSYVDDFMAVMQTAHWRWSPSGEERTLAKILNAGDIEVFKLLPSAPVYYLDAESLARLGGVERLWAIERALLKDINQDRKRALTKKHSKINDRAYARDAWLDGQMQKKMPDFMEQMRTFLEGKLSAIAGTPIRLHARPLTRMSFRKTILGKDGYVEASFRLNLHEWNQHYDFKSKDFATEVTRPMLARLARGESVSLSLRRVFSQRSSGVHVVLVNGAAIAGGRFEGLQYMNSWSPKFGRDGFGFVSAHLLEAEFHDMIAIDEIELGSE